MNRLTVLKRTDFGYYLDGGDKHGRILLPNNEVKMSGRVIEADGTEVSLQERSKGLPPILHRDEQVDVFLYLDQEERLIATMQKPLAQVGDFACLEVAWVNQYGAFLNWGLMKDLFVPFREQKMRMQQGHSYVVYVKLDEDSYRIMATAKIERYLMNDQFEARGRRFTPDGRPLLSPLIFDYKCGTAVDALVWQKTDLGFKVIIDNKFGALLYDNQVFCDLHTGDRVTAYIQHVRPDGKIDVTLQRSGQLAVNDFSQVLLDYLNENQGSTVLCDKSPAEEIYEVFGVSKKVFKKAVGDLYRQRLIEISDRGIKLVK